MSVPGVSQRRRSEIIDALRRGTVPRTGLDQLAVGLHRFEAAVEEELGKVAAGGAAFKAIRGEYGAGKTFVARWLVERAKRRGMAAAEVQISETETPLHRLETVYRRLAENLATAEYQPSAFRSVLDAWLFTLEEDALGADPDRAHDPQLLHGRVEELLERRLASVSQAAPSFAMALRGYRRAVVAGDTAAPDGLAAWLGGQPNVAAAVRRTAGIRGDLDHFGALGFLQGLLAVLRDSGHPGMVLVLDEAETLQRMRSDTRDKALNALRQLVDELDAGRYPGLYLVITGTPAFFDGQQGVQRLPPLAQRLATDLATDPRFDNPRAVQLRLPGFSLPALVELGRKVRDLYVSGCREPQRVAAVVDDGYVEQLARALADRMGGRVGVTPRLFLKKLVGDVLDRVEQYPEFNPRQHYRLTLAAAELTDVERNAAAASPDDIALDLP